LFSSPIGLLKEGGKVKPNEIAPDSELKTRARLGSFSTAGVFVSTNQGCIHFFRRRSIMCKKTLYCVALGMILASSGHAADVNWTGLAGDRLWSNPANWSSNEVPGASDIVFVDVPAALAPNGPIIQSGDEAKINGLLCEKAGEPTMTMTGGTLDISDYIWWGDGPDCFGTFYMSGGTVTTAAEFELGWGGGGGIWYMTGGTINAQELVIPTGTGVEGILYLNGGICNVGNGGLSMTDVGLIDIGAGTMTLEGDHTDQINDLIGNGQIIAYGGSGRVKLDYNLSNPGMTTVTAEGSPKASEPQPENEAVDVLRDIVLSWTPGAFAPATNAHMVYFGENFNDVNDGIGGIAQDANSFAPSQTLDFGKTYYWRVDEVNGAPDYTVHQGEVWSFTVEPYAYPVENVTVTASSAQANMEPERTIDGSGLDALDQHSTLASDMWLTGAGDAAPSIQYEFDMAYKLHEMWVWNSNQLIEAFLGLGVKDVIIEISQDGADWTVIEDTQQFAQAPGNASYTHNTIVNFGGVMARFVKITVTSGWGMLAQYGLSEVRFFYVPVHAREPQPAADAIMDGVDVVLKWRAGREAASHEVSFGTDAAAVGDGTAPVTTTDAPSLDLSAQDLVLNTTYYWRITEVNEAADPSSHVGDIWSFSTPAFVAVDNFDQYDDDCQRIFFTWLDGLGHNGSEDCGVAPYDGNLTGAIVGNAEPSFAETAVVISGQSMPLAYDNSVAPFYSEAASDDFSLPTDWTKGGAEILSLSVRGIPGSEDNPGNDPEPLYIAVTDSAGQTKRIEHPDPDVALAGDWLEWQIPFSELNGLNLANIKRVALGLGNPDSPASGGAGLVYIDEIRVGKTE